MKYERELQVALEAARRAGELILEEYRRFQAIPDAPADISTDADRQSQEIILGHIHEMFPGDALCAEETTPTLEKAPRSGPRLWVVDPIDGTRGFARKNGEFSVMVAFAERGEPAAGVVLEPAKGRWTFAWQGGGCWKQDGVEQVINLSAAPVSGTGQHCQVTSVSRLQDATVTQSHSKDPNKPSRHIQALKPARVIETYSAGIKLAQVARGEADIYLNTYDAAHDWDICAGQILLTESGGRATNFRGEPFRYGLPGAVHHHGLLASNNRLQEAALAALKGL
jgi:3'(2'), 5'-bisphosphate nucleotidase